MYHEFNLDRESLIKLFAQSIIESIDGAEFHWETFFKKWYRENGQPYFFLFKKNLGVTNSQYSELFALLGIHSYNFLDPTQTKLLFYSTEHIRSTFSEAISSLLENYTPGDRIKIETFASRYIEVFGATIAVDMFYGSCAVFLPGNINTNLEKVVFDSGYIHSAGRSIYIRNIKKAKKNALSENIKVYLENQQDIVDKVPFVVYSHEDFSAYDKEFAEQIDRGIEQCKIYVEKMSMGLDRLATIISELGETFSDRLFVPKPGDYRTEHQFKKGKTLWLISDKAISSGNLRNPGSSRYYICYEQTLKNDSPFFFFDENKPAWKSHTTLPHSLTSALLNTARPFLRNGLICDPFGGTGTTWFEVKRLKLEMKVKCSDLSPAIDTLVKDNLEFFCMSALSLEQLVNNIKACIPITHISNQVEMGFNQDINHLDHYGKVLEMIDGLKKAQPHEDQEFTLNAAFIQELNTLPFLTRILFFIGLRAELRFQGGIKRKALTFENAFKKSKDTLIEQIEIFIQLKKEIESQITTDTDLNSSYLKTLATYSYKLTPSFIFSPVTDTEKSMSLEITSDKDARDLDVDSCDLIICDPPYGFNTTEDETGLPNLYSEFLDKAIAALRAHGQLILCLPSESFTGRELPFCTRSNLVSRQILIKAHKQGRIVYSPAKSLPLNSFGPPYYWEAERALRRNILHFTFF